MTLSILCNSHRANTGNQSVASGLLCAIASLLICLRRTSSNNWFKPFWRQLMPEPISFIVFVRQLLVMHAGNNSPVASYLRSVPSLVSDIAAASPVCANRFATTIFCQEFVSITMVSKKTRSRHSRSQVCKLRHPMAERQENHSSIG